MIDAYQSGLTLDAVGELHGITSERVRQLFVRHDYNHRHSNGVALEKALAAIATPGTRKEIALRMGVSYSNLALVLSRHGLTASFVSGWGTKYTDDELLNHLRSLAKKLGRTPGHTDLCKDSPPGTSAYQKRFGSLCEAQRRAGLVPNKTGRRRDYAEGFLLTHLRLLAQRLGHTPTFRDLRTALGPSAACYHYHFGSLCAAQQLAGLAPNVHGRRAMAHG